MSTRTRSLAPADLVIGQEYAALFCSYTLTYLGTRHTGEGKRYVFRANLSRITDSPDKEEVYADADIGTTVLAR